jgi:hypothetical protein
MSKNNAQTEAGSSASMTCNLSTVAPPTVAEIANRQVTHPYVCPVLFDNGLLTACFMLYLEGSVVIIKIAIK